MTHDWEDVDQLLSAIDEETEGEALAFAGTGGPGVLVTDLLDSDGPHGLWTWPALTVEERLHALRVITEAFQPIFNKVAKVIMDMHAFFEENGVMLVPDGRLRRLPKRAKRPPPTRKGWRSERAWHR